MKKFRCVMNDVELDVDAFSAEDAAENMVELQLSYGLEHSQDNHYSVRVDGKPYVVSVSYDPVYTAWES